MRKEAVRDVVQPQGILHTHTHTQAQPQLLAWDEQPQPPSRLAPFITWPPEKPSLDTIPPAHHHTEKKEGVTLGLRPYLGPPFGC